MSGECVTESISRVTFSKNWLLRIKQVKIMEIKTINKASYRKKVNIIIVGFVFLLVVSSIVCGAILIYFFGNHHIVPDQSTGNFYWNFLGVLLGLAITLTLVNSIKRWPYFSEVRYIWQLKQIQNKMHYF